MEAHFFLGALPVAFKALGWEQVALHLELTPEAEAIAVLPETLGGDFSALAALLHGSLLAVGESLVEGRSRLTVRVPSVDSQPGLRRLGVHVLVIIGLERQPAARSLGLVTELDALKFELVHLNRHSTYQVEEQLFNVELLEVNFLFSFDHLALSGSALHRRVDLSFLLLLLSRRLIAVRVEPRNRGCWCLSLQH